MLDLSPVAPYRDSATVGARWTLAGASARNLDTATPFSAGHGLVDRFASHAYNDRVSGDLSVTNLFNRNYTQVLDTEPNPGLTVKAGLTLEFAAK